MFPIAFEQQMRQILGDQEWRLLAAALHESPPISIRRHSGRQPTDISLLPLSDGSIPWHPDGYYLKERPVFTLDPLFHAGAYYVQEASSMFVREVLRQTGKLGKPLRVLDLCAAPGGKTTLLNDALASAQGGLLVANEVIPARAAVLRENLERWGMAHAAVLSAEVDKFAPLVGFFDLILTDAPCSGEGMFRKDPDAIGEWSPQNVAACTSRQQFILQNAHPLLAPNGLLIYSTCTYNQRENEETFEKHLSQFQQTPVTLNIPAEWGIVSSSCGYRFYPHRTKGEGFFIAAYEKNAHGNPEKWNKPANFKHLTALPKKQIDIIKPWLNNNREQRFWLTPSGEILAIPSDVLDDMLVLDPVFKNKWFGSPIGTIKGADFIPGHALAMSTLLAPTPQLALSREEALIFLKKETFVPPQNAPKGWALATFSGLPLGWVKVLPNRINNYLPQERRIRMDIKI